MDEQHHAEGGEVPSRYRVHLLPRAKATERGILYLRGEEQFLLAWDRVKQAFAARVGEAGRRRRGVRPRGRGDRPRVRHLPPRGRARRGASACARAIELGVAVDARTPGLRALAHEGSAQLRFPDLETFGEASLESIRFLSR